MAGDPYSALKISFLRLKAILLHTNYIKILYRLAVQAAKAYTKILIIIFRLKQDVVSANYWSWFCISFSTEGAATVAISGDTDRFETDDDVIVVAASMPWGVICEPSPGVGAVVVVISDGLSVCSNSPVGIDDVLRRFLIPKAG